MEHQIMGIKEAAEALHMSVESFKADFAQVIHYPRHSRKNQGFVLLDELQNAVKDLPHTPREP